MPWLERGAIVLVLLVVIGLPAAAFSYEGFLRSQHDNEFTLVATVGTWTPNTIRVKQGEVVRLRLTSEDVVHGFLLEEFDIAVDAVYPGRFTTVEFVADRPGTFDFACTRVCSVTRHGHMWGTLVVEPQEQAPAAGPSLGP